MSKPRVPGKGRAFGALRQLSEVSISRTQDLHIQHALKSTAGLERRLKKRGRHPLIQTGEEADAWAKGQPWYPRVVLKQSTPNWWVWWTRPEGGL